MTETPAVEGAVPAEGRQQQVPLRVWGLLAACFLLSAGFIATVILPASVLPLVGATFDVETGAVSASISAVFLTWALLQIPGGLVLDRGDNRRLVALGALGFVVVTPLGLLTDSYAVFLASRLVGGACAVFMFVGSIAILSHVVPAHRRGLALSIFIASPPFGIALAQFTGPLIAAAVGWRTAALTYVGLAGLGGVGIVVLRRAPVVAGGTLRLREFGATLRSPAVLLVSIASMCTYVVWTFLVTWMPTYGTEVLGLDLAAAGAVTALVPLAGIVARPGGGWLSDALGGRLLPVFAISFLATIALVLVIGRAASPLAFALSLALAGAAVNLCVGLYLVFIDRLAPAATRGTSLSVLLTFSQVGNLIAPVVGGWLITTYSWTAGFGFAAGLAASGLGTILVVTVLHGSPATTSPPAERA